MGVTSIGEYAFYGCPQLEQVILSDVVTEIKDYAFANCTSLDNVELPVSLTTIGDYAFYSCTSLSEIDLPYQVSSVGSRAFAYCSSMKSISLPTSLKSISSYAFYRCLALEEAVIPSTTTSIGESAFQSCNTMKRLVLGEAVSTIGKSAFKGCIALEDIMCKAKTVPTISGECFSDVTYNQTTLQVRRALLENYETANYWRKFNNRIAMPYEIEYEGIYYVRNTIYSVELGVSFKDYNYNSYKGDIVIPRGFPFNGSSWSVKTIADDAFRDFSVIGHHKHRRPRIHGLHDAAHANHSSVGHPNRTQSLCPLHGIGGNHLARCPDRHQRLNLRRLHESQKPNVA